MKAFALWFLLATFLLDMPCHAAKSVETYASTNLVVLKPWAEKKETINWPSIASVCIAAAVGIVGLQQYLLARQQFRLAREKFKLDLFEKRFAVYKGTQKYLAEILRDGRLDLEESIQFLRETQDATFLFDHNIVEYLDSLYRRGVDLMTLNNKLEGVPVGPERNELCEREGKLLKELTDEIVQIKDVFAPYLRFKLWK